VNAGTTLRLAVAGSRPYTSSATMPYSRIQRDRKSWSAPGGSSKSPQSVAGNSSLRSAGDICTALGTGTVAPARSRRTGPANVLAKRIAAGASRSRHARVIPAMASPRNTAGQRPNPLIEPDRPAMQCSSPSGLAIDGSPEGSRLRSRQDEPDPMTEDPAHVRRQSMYTDRAV
jgi:hypothetical protein